MRVAMMEAKRRDENPDDVLTFMVIALPLSVLGARLYHVISSWGFYSQNPRLILAIWETGGGLGIYGVIVGALIALIIFTRHWKKDIRVWMDIFAPMLILGQAIGRWGNYFNQELYGLPTNLPWAIYIDPSRRLSGYEAFSRFHPLFLYESILDLIGFFMLMYVARKIGKKLPKGDIMLLYAMYYSVVRFFLEGLRIPSEVWTLAGIPTARWICVITIVAGLIILVIQDRRRTKEQIPMDQE
jgi:phosphatidylglycerol:prolipoprotein diacylglycerol transferase